jgi:hypothetical protein
MNFLKWFKKRESQLSLLGAFSAILLGVLLAPLSLMRKNRRMFLPT